MQIRISTRVVLLVGSYAIKIPVDRRGWLQGLNEIYLYDKYACIGQLAPLVWWVGGVVVQRRCKPLPVRLVKYYARRIKENIPELNVRLCDLYQPNNWGVYRGKVVLLDYGITEEVSRMYKRNQ